MNRWASRVPFGTGSAYIPSHLLHTSPTHVRIGMRKKPILSPLVLLACVCAYSAQCLAQAAPPLKLVQTIPMPQVKCHNPELNDEQLVQSVDTEFMPTMTCHFDRIGLDLKGG